MIQTPAPSRPRVPDFFEPGDIDLSDEEAASWLDYFRRNKLPLLSLQRQSSNPLWRARLEAQWQEYRGQRQEYLRAREAWAGKGIGCIAIKSGGFFPSLPYTSDNLDLLVLRPDRDQAARILQGLGYVWLQNIDEPEKLLFRRFHSGRSVSAIHLHTWVGWEVEFMEDSVWYRAAPSEDDPCVVVPSPEDALLINAAHAFYENKRFTLFDLLRISRQWCRDDFDWRYAYELAQRRGWLNGLHFALTICADLEDTTFGACSAPPEERRRWQAAVRTNPLLERQYAALSRRTKDLPFAIPFVFSKLLYYGKVARDGHDSRLRRLLNVARTLVWGVRLKAHVNPQAGMLITFSGIDGAGKSTYAGVLSSAMRVAALSHAVVWNRRGCGRLHRAFSSLLRPIRGAPPAGRTGRMPPTPPSKPAALLWSFAGVVDLLVEYTLRVRLRLLRGDIVIADRYVADAAAEMRARLGPRASLAEPLIGALRYLSPRPDLAFLVDAEPQAAGRHTADVEDSGEMQEARRLLLREARRSGMTLLPPAWSCDANVDELSVEVLRSYYRRYPTLPNALTLSNPKQLNDVDALLREAEGLQP